MPLMTAPKLLLGALAFSSLTLAGCDDVTTSGHVSYGVYYDSMMWNDYYRPRPPQSRPPRPVHPIAPAPPARPTPPIHRPRPR